MAYKITEECIACDACVPECPAECIAEGDPIYTIDAEKVHGLRGVRGGVSYRGVRPGVTRTSPGLKLAGREPAGGGERTPFRPLFLSGICLSYNSFSTSLSNASLSM